MSDQQPTTPATPQATGDDVMSAARATAADTWPDAAPTMSDFANQVFRNMLRMLNDNEQI